MGQKGRLPLPWAPTPDIKVRILLAILIVPFPGNKGDCLDQNLVGVEPLC